jgi:hypothetical protein
VTCSSSIILFTHSVPSNSLGIRCIVVFVIDDGTGVLECFRYFGSKTGERQVSFRDDTSEVALGDLVLFRGVIALKLTDFGPSMPFSELEKLPRELSILLKYVEKVDDANFEMHHWARCSSLHTDVYSQPFMADASS